MPSVHEGLVRPKRMATWHRHLAGVPLPSGHKRDACATRPTVLEVLRKAAFIAGIALCLPLLPTVAGAAALIDVEATFVWNEAHTRMVSARTEEDFLRAAEKYAELVRMGARSGPLFYNMGTALLLAGQHEEAYDALLRAERYLGTTFEVRRNMLLAIAGIEDTDGPALPWYRVPLFWHFRLPMSLRWMLAAVFFNLVWIALGLRAAGLRRPATPLLWSAAILFALFASSAATSQHAETVADRTIAVTATTTRQNDVSPGEAEP